jgi:hypothetical protein
MISWVWLPRSEYFPNLLDWSENAPHPHGGPNLRPPSASKHTSDVATEDGDAVESEDANGEDRIEGSDEEEL